MERERQVTFAPHGHILTNVNVWSPDSRWVVYDVRSDEAGAVFDGERIEAVNVETGEVRVVYEARDGAHCGVATWSPVDGRIVFILGPEHPTAEWNYGVSRRQGVVVDFDRPGEVMNLEARDLAAPFTPGALRGGTHVHVFRADGKWVSFTYDDEVVAGGRNVGIAVPREVMVGRGHPRNHDGSCFSVLVTRTTVDPAPGSDEIRRAYEDGWVGCDRIAFLGEVVARDGLAHSEVFVAELPGDLTIAGEGPIEGTEVSLPAPPAGVVQRRLTFTEGRKFPGVCGPRHWVRGSRDGSRVAFLMKDDAGVGQIWTVSPEGGEMKQVTRNPWAIGSAFTWTPDGEAIVHVADGSVFLTDVETGEGKRLTVKSAAPPRPEACVISPDGRRIAFVRTVEGHNQVFVVDV